MTYGKEGGKEEKGACLLDETKAKLNKAIHSPLLPSIVPVTLSSVLTRIIPLSPDEFIAAGMSRYGGRITPENESLIRESANSCTAAYCDQYPADGKPAIIIKQAYLNSDPSVEVIASLLAEELGHAFSKAKEIPLADMKDQPTYILPEETREKTVAVVNKELAQRGDLDSPAKIDDITVKIRGFNSVFIDKRTEYYVIFGGPYILEETRSAFVQAILDIIMAGQESAPFRSPENQFAQGHRSLQLRTWYDSRFRGAMKFIDIYLSGGKSLKHGLQKLLKALYNQDVDQFNLS